MSHGPHAPVPDPPAGGRGGVGRRVALNDFFSFFSVALLTATLRSTTPLLFAAMGGLISERSGVTNIALEGLMLLGAFAAVTGTYYTGRPFIGLLVGVVAAALVAAIFAVWCVTLRADQIVAGTAVVLLGLGVTAFLVQRIWGQAGGSPSVARLPSIGGLNILIPVAFAVVPLVHYVLFTPGPASASSLLASIRRLQKASASTSLATAAPASSSAAPSPALAVPIYRLATSHSSPPT